MEQITFEHLPKVVGEIRDRLLRIEKSLENLASGENHGNELMTISEAAIYLNLAVSTIYGKVCRMEIPVHKKGKRLYFDRLELSDWIREGRKRTVEELSREADKYLRGRIAHKRK